MNSLRFLHKLCYLWCISLILSSVNAQPVNWSSSTSYSIGDLVFNAQTSYIAIQPSINIHPTNISYWANLNKAAQALDIPVEEVPSLPVNTILNALPNSIPSNSHIISVSTFPPFGGVIVGNLEVLEGNSTTLNAIPSTGYLFARWSGDINGTASSLTLSVNSALTISARFTQDFNDSDGDGLSNYEEAQLGSNLNEINTDLAAYICPCWSIAFAHNTVACLLGACPSSACMALCLPFRLLPFLPLACSCFHRLSLPVPLQLDRSTPLPSSPVVEPTLVCFR